ncbi:MAG: dihydrodipicolinate synthase family protein [Clostridia bacterium]|nr:dihydrodipicolinate synthase family protein [Clostridia bacterium]
MQKSNILFTGVMPAFVTPFDENRALKRDAVKSLMDMEYQGGVKGFYINGATGEGTVLSAKLRMEMAEAAVEFNKGRGVLINHVGAPNFEDVKALALHSKDLGVDALSSLVPNYFSDCTDDEIVDYYSRLASYTDLPILVYATPLIHSDVVKLMGRLLEIPTVIGCKFTRWNYYELSRVKMLNDGNVNVINGPDEMFVSGLAMGADGGIGSTYNVLAERFVAVYDAYQKGDVVKAREIQYGINKIIYVILSHGKGNLVKSLKGTLTLMGYDAGDAAYPASQMDKADLAALKADLIAAGFEKCL